MSEQYPFDAVDLGFMLLAPTHPIMIGACVVQFWARRSPMVVRALLQAGATLPDTPQTRALLPGYARVVDDNPPALPAPAAGAVLAAVPQRQRANTASRAAAIDARIDTRPAAIAGAITLDQIANLDNIWIIGPKGSGKTTVLKALLAMRDGAHTALDPHATPGKWTCNVVGGGRQYSAIDGALTRQVKLMDERYKAMHTGELTEDECKGAARRTIVGDEWLSITESLPGKAYARGKGEDAEAEPGAASRLLTILTEGRKAGVCVLTAGHADTATSMGFSGKKDILKCFDVMIYLGAIAVERYPEAAKMPRPAVVYDPERNTWTPLDLTNLARPQAAPAAADPPDDFLTSLLNSVSAQPSDGMTIAERERMTIARRLAPTMGKTKAIRLAFEDASSSARYQHYARLFDQGG